MTLGSPQSHAPPPKLLNMLKSCPSWFPPWKQSAQIDMHGVIPHVLQRYATKFAVHTKPQAVASSYSFTSLEKSSNDLPPVMSSLNHSRWSTSSIGFPGSVRMLSRPENSFRPLFRRSSRCVGSSSSRRRAAASFLVSPFPTKFVCHFHLDF